MNLAYIITIPIRLAGSLFMLMVAPIWFVLACLDDDIQGALEETLEQITQFWK